METLRYVFLAIVLLALTAGEDHAQNNITNTLGTGGVFTIRDATNPYFSLSQTSGNATFFRNIELGNQEIPSSTVGVITKGGGRFIHNYQPENHYGYNTFVGIEAGNFTMGGGPAFYASYNTSVGYQSLNSLSTGHDNSAFGWRALCSNTSGVLNSAFGSSSLYYNTEGNWNSAFGHLSLYLNTTGYGNSAFGLQSLFVNTEGYYNSAFGYSSLRSNTTGVSNSAFGCQSLSANTEGTANSALGVQSLGTNTTGSYNSAFGWRSLQANTTGSYNTSVGFDAGYNVTDGSNLTLLGYNASASSASATNEITLGDGNITTLRCQVATITAISDARDKKNIRDLNLGLDFLMTVKPRLFNWDRREWYKDNRADGSKMEQTPTAGFIAQELDEVQTNEQAEWLKLVLKSNPDRLEATPGNLLPIVVKAVQELKRENESLRGRVLAQQQEIETLRDLKARVAMLEQTLGRPSSVGNVGLIGERWTNGKEGVNKISHELENTP